MIKSVPIILTSFFAFVICLIGDDVKDRYNLTPFSIDDKQYSSVIPSNVIKEHTLILHHLNNHSSNFDALTTSNGQKNGSCQFFKTTTEIESQRNIKEYEKYDDISEDDIVRSQYKLLPYPPVAEEQLLEEKDFYKRTISKTFESYYQLNLESLNHYLYNGRNEFK